MKNVVFNIITIAISSVALVFSIFVFCNHQHQLLEDKQIDAILGLIDYIQNCKLTIRFTLHTTEEEDKEEFQIYTFFELADTTIRSDMNQAPIYFPSKEWLPIDFTPYINNPLIPSEIATKLRDYYHFDVQHQSSYDATVMDNVIITRFQEPHNMRMNHEEILKDLEHKYNLDSITLEYGDQFVTMQHIPAFRTFGQLKTSNKELYDLIIKWFNDKGMDNVNLPIDARLYEKKHLD